MVEGISRLESKSKEIQYYTQRLETKLTFKSVLLLSEILGFSSSQRIKGNKYSKALLTRVVSMIFNEAPCSFLRLL